MLRNTLENWPIIAVVAILLGMLGCRAVLFFRWLKQRQIKRNFAKFEASLLDPDPDPNGSPFLTGETKLPTDITIHLPGRPAIDPLLQSIEKGLATHSFGFVIRHFEVGDDFGVDVHLNDFVAGVAFLRDCLLENQAPAGTVIEYGGGDLYIHD